MLKLISASSAFYGTGLSMQRKLFRVASGPYAGRAAALVPVDAAVVKLTWSDPPHLNWSAPLTIVSDAADFPIAGWMDGQGNIYVAYTRAANLDLVSLKLSFANGAWSAGSPTVIFNADSNYFPSIYKDIYDRLWVSWSREAGGSFSIQAKISINDGQVWGTGPGDPGDTLISGGSAAYSQLVYLPTFLYCFYAFNGTKLAYRRFEMAGAVWYSEVAIHNGSGLADNFCAAVSSDQKIGVAFQSGSDLLFKDFDGAAWGGNYTLDSGPTVPPVLQYNGTIPFVFYGKQLGSGQQQLLYTFRSGASFTAGQRVSGEVSALDKVLCFRPQAAVQFADRTAEGADSDGGDVYHPDSGKVMLSSGDALFLGQAARFSQINVTLSTVGAGGTVSWYYWSGGDWKSFTPSSGAYHFGSSPALVRLWNDSAAIPADWQSCTVNGASLFWIKAVANGAFGVGPVGSQFTAATAVSCLSAA